MIGSKSNYFIFAVLMLMPGMALADTGFIGTSFGVETISKIIVNLGEMLGLGLFVLGLYGFYARGDNPNQYPASYCVTTVLSGAFLVMSSTAYMWTVNSVSEVNWATDNSMLAIGSKLATDAGAIQSSFLGKYLTETSFSTLMGFIYLIGLVGFIRGLYLFKDSGKLDNAQEGGFAKAFWHVAGGAALMNIVQVSCFISWLLGIPMICMG